MGNYDDTIPNWLASSLITKVTCQKVEMLSATDHSVEATRTQHNPVRTHEEHGAFPMVLENTTKTE